MSSASPPGLWHFRHSAPPTFGQTSAAKYLSSRAEYVAGQGFCAAACGGLATSMAFETKAAVNRMDVLDNAFRRIIHMYFKGISLRLDSCSSPSETDPTENRFNCLALGNQPPRDANRFSKRRGGLSKRTIRIMRPSGRNATSRMIARGASGQTPRSRFQPFGTIRLWTAGKTNRELLAPQNESQLHPTSV